MNTIGGRIIDSESSRMLPELTDVNRPYWIGGERGKLFIHYCDVCERWVHPPAACCGACSGLLEARPVSGRGTLFSFTINEQIFNPEVEPPYTIAIVVLDEQDDLRLPTNIVGGSGTALEIGMAVRVVFERNGEHFVPLFEIA